MNASLRRYLLGQFVSQLGSWIGLFATLWLVANTLKLTTSHNALVLVAGLLVGVCGSPLGPRILRKSTVHPRDWMIRSHLVSAVTSLLLALAIQNLATEALFIFLLTVKVTSSVLSIVATPATADFVRCLGTEEEVYATHMRLTRITWQTRALAGLGTAVIISYFSIAAAIFLNGLTFLFFSWILYTLPEGNKHGDDDSEKPNYAERWWKSWWRAWSNSFTICRAAKPLVMVLGAWALIQAIFLLSFVYCIEIFNIFGAHQFNLGGLNFAVGGLWFYGLHVTLTGVCGTLGSVVAGRLQSSSSTRKKGVFVTHALLMPGLIALAAYAPEVWMFIAVQMVVSFLTNPLTTLIQYELNRNKTLTVHTAAVNSFFVQGLVPLCAAVVTRITNYLGITAREALFTSGVTVLVLLILWLLYMARNGGKAYSEFLADKKA